MHMGNFRVVWTLVSSMAAKNPSVGIQHVTVVPTNYDAEGGDSGESAERAERGDCGGDADEVGADF